jgi:hypothetical protein
MKHFLIENLENAVTFKIEDHEVERLENSFFRDLKVSSWKPP